MQKLESRDYTVWNCCVHNALRKKQWHYFFCGAPKISRKNDLYKFTLGEKWQNKIKKNYN